MRACGALAALFAAVSFARAEPRIELVPSDGRTVVEVKGLDDAALAAVQGWSPEKWSTLFAVRVRLDDAPAILGAWQEQSSSSIRFTPRFPLEPKVAYRAEFFPGRLPGAPGDARKVVLDFLLDPPAHGPAAVVTQVFPTAAEVPENLLKFYLHFSAPMSRGHIYDHIHLRDEAGKDVELPFLEIDEELWDPEMKRLTLFIDPGRIKRGVLPLEEIGPSLQEGHRFTLAIDPEWLDATGRPLAQKYERTFRVTAPDRNAIDLRDWKLSPPNAGEAAPLIVKFSKPMDHALALRLLKVTHENGTPVKGTTALTDEERRWTFTPVSPWQSGTFHLVVPPILEDLSGNNVGKAFEIENLGEPRSLGQPEKLPFEVK